MSLQTDLAVAVASAQANAATLQAIVHGPAAGPSSLVATEAGNVKTLARITAEATAAAGAGVVPFSPPVAWSTGLTAVVGPPATAVTHQGESYYCNTGHLTGATFAADSAKWTKFAAKGADAAAVLTTQGDLLTHDGTVAARLARGADGTMLYMNGNNPAWRTLAAQMAAVIGASAQGSVFHFGSSAALAALAPASDPYKALFSAGASANPTFAGTWKVLAEATPSGASSMDFTGIPASVHHLMLLWELLPGTNTAGLDLRTHGADGIVDSGGSDYNYVLIAMNSAAASGIGSATGSSVRLHSTTGLSNNSSWSSQGHAIFTNIQAARYTGISWQSQMLGSDGNMWSFAGSGRRLEADRITGLQIFPSAGTISGRGVLLAMSN